MTDGNGVDAEAVETDDPDQGTTGPEAGSTRDQGTAATESPTGPPEGFVRLRVALAGVGLLWLAAVAAVGAILAAVYGLTSSPAYFAVAVAAATLSAIAAYASLRTFGFA